MKIANMYNVLRNEFYFMMEISKAENADQIIHSWAGAASQFLLFQPSSNHYHRSFYCGLLAHENTIEP